MKRLVLEKVLESLTKEEVLLLSTSVSDVRLLAEGPIQGDSKPDHDSTNRFRLLTRLNNEPLVSVVSKVLVLLAVRTMATNGIDLKKLKELILRHGSILTAIRTGELESALCTVEQHLREMGAPVVADNRKRKAAWSSRESSEEKEVKEG